MRFLLQEAKYFMTALQFLTRLPAPQFQGFEPLWLDRGVKYFPLVGALVGSICAGVLLGAGRIWSGAIPALLAVAAGMLATGALHEDGAADFFDALGGTSREARLAIMKDHRLGVYGALALGVLIAAKTLALSAPPPTAAAIALVAAHAGGRLAAVFTIAVFSYAGDLEAAKVRPLAAGARGPGLLLAALFGLAPLLFMPAAAGAIALLAGAGAAALIALRARSLLGGYTGDVLGAVEQSYEAAFLLGAAACA